MNYPTKIRMKYKVQYQKKSLNTNHSSFDFKFRFHTIEHSFVKMKHLLPSNQPSELFNAENETKMPSNTLVADIISITLIHSKLPKCSCTPHDIASRRFTSQKQHSISHLFGWRGFLRMVFNLVLSYHVNPSQHRLVVVLRKAAAPLSSPQWHSWFLILLHPLVL